MRDGEHVTPVPSNLAVFRVGSDGKLEFVGTENVSAAERANLFWMGVVPLP